MAGTQRRARDLDRTLDDRLADLERAEATVVRDEAAVATELSDAESRAAAVTRELQGFLETLQEAVAKRGEVSELTPLYQRFRGTLMPQLDLDDHHERELTVREDAVRARAWVVSSLRLELRHLASEATFLERAIEEGRLELRDLQANRKTNPSMRVPREVDLPEIPRRELPRVRMEAEIDLHSTSNFFTGFSENISDGGLFIATDKLVPVGSEIDLAFRLPSGVEIRGRGVVRWLRTGTGDGQEAGVGIQFHNLSGAAAEAIETFIQARDPIFYPLE